MKETERNLEEAFAGESQARNKYTFFADKAEEEGKSGVAKLFRAAAMSEKVHARNHLRVMEKIKSTEENLKDAIGGEKSEYTEMYPEFVQTAREEAEDRALMWFDYARQIEKKHSQFYEEALEAVQEDEDLEEENWYVCDVCGNTVKEEPPDQCPICGAPKEKFMEVE